MALLAKVLLEEPVLLSSRVNLPAALETAVHKLIAKKPERRPATAAEALALLEAPMGGAMSLKPMAVREQKLVCAIAVAPMVSDDPDGDTLVSGSGHSRAELKRIAESYGAWAEALADGSLIAVFTGAAAATDLVGRAAELALEVKRRLPEAPIALATGQAVLVDGRLPLGEAVDRACRAALDQREAFGVGLDALAAGLLGPRFVLDATGRRLLTLASTTVEDGARPLLGKPTPFVGRDRELTSLTAAYGQLLDDGRPAVVLVTAPAGYGKSRLRLELSRRLREQRPAPSVMFARCEPMRADSPLSIAAELLRSLLALEDGTSLEAAVRARVDEAEVKRVTAFTAELLGLGFPDDYSAQLAAARRDPALLKVQTRRAFEELLLAQAKSGPVAVMLEDLHWGDQASVQLLDQLLGRLREAPIFLCAFARPEVTQRFERLWEERGLQLIRLPELSKKACERLARQVLGDGAPQTEVDRIVAVAAGNAFYLEELIRTAASGSSTELPQTVVAMAQARLEALDSDDRRLLRAAAVLGENFWEGGVVALTSFPQTPQRLAKLVEKEVLLERTRSALAGQKELAFRHAYLRDAAYAMLPAEDRTHAHLLAAQWLQSAGEIDPRRLAGHYELGGDKAAASKWYVAASDQAIQRGDWDGAREAVAKGRALGQPEHVAAFAASDLEAMRWVSLYDLVVKESDSALLLAPVGSRLWLRIAASAALGFGVSHARERSAALAQQLIDAEPAEADMAMFCVAAARLAIQLFINNSIDTAVRLLTRLEAAAAPLLDGAPYVRGWVDETRGFALARIDDGPGAVDAWERSRRAFAEAGDSRNERAQRSNQSYVQAAMCTTPEVLRLTAGLIAEARSENITGVLGGALINLGWVQFIDGHPDHQATLREAAAVCDQLVDGRHPPMAHGILSTALLEAGDLAGAEREAAKAVEVADRTHYVVDVRVAMARVRLHQGRAREALDQLGQPLNSLMAQPLIFRDLGHHIVRAQALEALGDHEGHRSSLWDAVEVLKNLEKPLPEATKAHWRTRLPITWLLKMAAAAKIPL
jgi:hypothetical protein